MQTLKLYTCHRITGRWYPAEQLVYFFVDLLKILVAQVPPRGYHGSVVVIAPRSGLILT